MASCRAENYRKARHAVEKAMRNLRRCSPTTALPYAGCKVAKAELRRALSIVDKIERCERQKSKR